MDDYSAYNSRVSLKQGEAVAQKGDESDVQSDGDYKIPPQFEESKYNSRISLKKDQAVGRKVTESAIDDTE